MFQCQDRCTIVRPGLVVFSDQFIWRENRMSFNLFSYDLEEAIPAKCPVSHIILASNCFLDKFATFGTSQHIFLSPFCHISTPHHAFCGKGDTLYLKDLHISYFLYLLNTHRALALSTCLARPYSSKLLVSCLLNHFIIVEGKLNLSPDLLLL